jgi:hypothetical protein
MFSPCSYAKNGTVNGNTGEEAILHDMTLNVGATDKNFSRQDETIHYLSAAPITAYLLCFLNCPILNFGFRRSVLSCCKMSFPYPGYRTVEEVYLKIK